MQPCVKKPPPEIAPYHGNRCEGQRYSDVVYERHLEPHHWDNHPSPPSQRDDDAAELIDGGLDG